MTTSPRVRERHDTMVHAHLVRPVIVAPVPSTAHTWNTGEPGERLVGDHAPPAHAFGVRPSRMHRYPAAPDAENRTVADRKVVETAGPDVIEIVGGGSKCGSAPIAWNEASDDGEV